MGGEQNTDLKPARIEALSDGIFAIAMTILVLSFETILHPPSVMTEKAILETIIGLWPDFVHYVESFVIIGAFWYQHHRQFHYIKRVDPVLLFLNIVGLMFIGLIPFTTVLMSDYGNMRTPTILFELNLLFAGLVFFLHWIYATRSHLVGAELDVRIINYYKARNLLIPAVSLVAMAFSLFHARLGALLFFVVPGILILWRKK